ncbi:MAG: two-component sensor histidine kinase [Hyphomicrobiaceae bacterium]|nr:two-component sensor histidine kinase [Hyphomicrobiaceae bacterium]
MSPANADKKSGGRKGGGRQADTDKALKVPPSGGASSQQVEPGDRDDVVSAVAAVRSAASPQGGLRRPVEHDLLLAAIPHPVLVVAEENRIVYGNSAAESFMSSGLSMLKRMSLDDLVVFGCPLLALVEQVRRTGVTINEYGVEIASPRFVAPKLVDVYGGPLQEQPGYIFLMLQQRAMAQMIERQLTHRAAARSVSGMASVLAHEIKNPLSGIRGAAQLIEPSLDDEDRALAQLICSETDRIRDLVDRMEVFGDERPLKMQPINIHDVLDHVRRLLETGLGRHVRFALDYDPSLPPVRGNRDKLIQAFLNLFKNAVEAVGDDAEQGRILVQTAFRPGVRLTVPGTNTRIALPLMIQIEDNGPGIPEHLRSQIFDPFVTTKPSGTGLGLALVAKIINDHGGIIECDSESGRTVFRILLPLLSPAAQGKSA